MNDTLAAGREAPATIRFYIGTYTGEKSKGIYLAELDYETGALALKGLAAETKSPSFLDLHPNGKFLYSVSEVSDFEGRRQGGVAAFAIDPESGLLKAINKQPSMGTGPCHVTVHPAGRLLLVANYGSGSAALLPILNDGSLGPAASSFQHQGSSVNKSRQEGPHAHCGLFDRSGRFAFVADLGADTVFAYRIDTAASVFERHPAGDAMLNPGSGPRHLAFHPSGEFLFVINELASTVTSFRFAAEGKLTELSTASTLPQGFKGSNTTAEVLVHPTGRFVYGSNRGHDSIAVFSVDAATGKLTPVGHQATGGSTPRNFRIDPTGRFLLAANQNSDTVVSFRIDPETGKLTPAGSTIHVGAPVCVKFLAK